MPYSVACIHCQEVFETAEDFTKHAPCTHSMDKNHMDITPLGIPKSVGFFPEMDRWLYRLFHGSKIPKKFVDPRGKGQNMNPLPLGLRYLGFGDKDRK